VRENCERVEELLVEQHKLLECVKQNQGDNANKLSTNLESMAEVKSQNEQLLERAECTLKELKRVNSPFTEDLQYMHRNLQHIHNKISTTYDAHTKDIRKLRKEQKRDSDMITNGFQDLGNIMLNDKLEMSSQVQDLSSQVVDLSSQLDEIKLEKLHEMELSQASVEDNQVLLKKMDSITRKLDKLSIGELQTNLQGQACHEQTQEFCNVSQLVESSISKMQHIYDNPGNCEHPWQIRGSDIALKVARGNTDKLKKFVRSEEGDFQGLRQMAIDCEVWSTIFGDQGEKEGSQVYALSGEIHRTTAGEIISYLTVELMSPSGKITGGEDVFRRPQTK